jgi:uncharacterized membrane-anchored protein
MNLRSLWLQLLLCLSIFTANAAPPGDSLDIYLEEYKQFEDSLNSALHYKTGKIDLEGGHVILNVPAGFKYLNKEQSSYVITELWGNPPSIAEEMVGMIFPENDGPLSDSSYAFIVTYSAIGYVKDDDANKIDYDDLLKNIQKEENAENIERKKAGYEPVYMIGWAQKPFYDGKRKILHWAKELKFGDGEKLHTLNYEVRILGRKGMLSLNAVSTIDQLALVNQDIPKILDIASFTEGNKYSDFNPDLDEVATWTIGGLVAGKILVKAGLFAVILKFLAAGWKFLLLALVPLGAWIRKLFTGGKKKEEELAPVTVQPEAPSDDNPV